MPNTEVGSVDLNYRGATARKLFFDPVFRDLNAQEIFGIMPNVVGQQKIKFASELQDILQENTGCGFNPIGSFDISKRQISVQSLKADVEQCWDEFKDTIWMEALKPGVDMYDLSNTQMFNMLLSRIRLAITKQINKLAFFGDEDSADSTVNLVNGMWTVYIKEAVQESLIQRINSNSGTALGSGEAIQLLDAVINGSTNELKAFEKSKKFILVSNNIMEQLEIDIREGVTGDSDFRRVVINGVEVTKFRGIDIKPMLRWESLAQSYFTGVSNNNLVLYSVKNNMVLATNRVSDMNFLKAQYDPWAETTKVKSAFALGFNYVHPSLMTVAY